MQPPGCMCALCPPPHPAFLSPPITRHQHTPPASNTPTSFTSISAELGTSSSGRSSSRRMVATASTPRAVGV
eukprot:361809-Chlamydomonas_euryale.AAC.9